MEQNLLAFKNSYEDFKEAFENFQNSLKNENAETISTMIKEGKFDDTQVAIDCLKELISEIQFQYDFCTVESALNKYTSKLKTIKSNSNVAAKVFLPEQISNLYNDSDNTADSLLAPTKQSVPKVKYQAKVNHSNHTIENITGELIRQQYSVIDVRGNRLNVKKSNKNLYLEFLNDTDFNQDYFYSLLEEMNELKNIGFVFKDNVSMKKAQVLLNEWVKTKPNYETRFLTVNLSNLEKLGSNNEPNFEIVQY